MLIANVVLFVLQQPFLLGMQTFEPFMLWPINGGGFDPFSPGQNFQPWQLLTYGFLHGGFTHLLFNMLALYMFGAPLELTWGPRRFLVYYLICVVGAGLCQLAVQLIARTGAAGKQQAVDIAQRAQRLTGFPPALHQVQHARRQASLFPQLHHRLAG